MSKILVVEPYKILQRAIAMSFFPEHEVEVTEQVPEMSPLEPRSYDVAIIDAGALREKNTAGDLSRRLQDWPIPIIWLEENIPTAAPIARNDLLAALVRCQANGSTIPLNEAGGKLRNRSVLLGTEPRPDSEHRARIIELVDVVQGEATGGRQDKRLERKKR
jgi:hypothetical protein